MPYCCNGCVEFFFIRIFSHFYVPDPVPADNTGLLPPHPTVPSLSYPLLRSSFPCPPLPIYDHQSLLSHILCFSLHFLVLHCPSMTINPFSLMSSASVFLSLSSTAHLSPPIPSLSYPLLQSSFPCPPLPIYHHQSLLSHILCFSLHFLVLHCPSITINPFSIMSSASVFLSLSSTAHLSPPIPSLSYPLLQSSFPCPPLPIYHHQSLLSHVLCFSLPFLVLHCPSITINPFSLMSSASVFLSLSSTAHLSPSIPSLSYPLLRSSFPCPPLPIYHHQSLLSHVLCFSLPFLVLHCPSITINPFSLMSSASVFLSLSSTAHLSPSIPSLSCPLLQSSFPCPPLPIYHHQSLLSHVLCFGLPFLVLHCPSITINPFSLMSSASVFLSLSSTAHLSPPIPSLSCPLLQSSFLVIHCPSITINPFSLMSSASVFLSLSSTAHLSPSIPSLSCPLLQSSFPCPPLPIYHHQSLLSHILCFGLPFLVLHCPSITISPFSLMSSASVFLSLSSTAHLSPSIPSLSCPLLQSSFPCPPLPIYHHQSLLSHILCFGLPFLVLHCPSITISPFSLMSSASVFLSLSSTAHLSPSIPSLSCPLLQSSFPCPPLPIYHHQSLLSHVLCFSLPFLVLHCPSITISPFSLMSSASVFLSLSSTAHLSPSIPSLSCPLLQSSFPCPPLPIYHHQSLLSHVLCFGLPFLVIHCPSITISPFSLMSSASVFLSLSSTAHLSPSIPSLSCPLLQSSFPCPPLPIYHHQSLLSHVLCFSLPFLVFHCPSITINPFSLMSSASVFLSLSSIAHLSPSIPSLSCPLLRSSFPCPPLPIYHHQSLLSHVLCFSLPFLVLHCPSITINPFSLMSSASVFLSLSSTAHLSPSIPSLSCPLLRSSFPYPPLPIYHHQSLLSHVLCFGLPFLVLHCPSITISPFSLMSSASVFLSLSSTAHLSPSVPSLSCPLLQSSFPCPPLPIYHHQSLLSHVLCFGLPFLVLHCPSITINPFSLMSSASVFLSLSSTAHLSPSVPSLSCPLLQSSFLVLHKSFPALYCAF